MAEVKPTPVGRPAKPGGPLRSFIRVLATLIIAVPLVAGAFLFVVQDRMIYFPRPYREPIGAMLRGTNAQLVEFQSGDERQVCYWVPGKDAGEDSPIWFVFGGNASRAFDWIDQVRAMQASHPEWSFVLVEYPGYGHSGGEPGRNPIIRVSGDCRAEIRRLTGLTSDQMARRTCILGHSMGAAAGLEFAASHGARVVVAISPFTDLVSMARRSVGPVYAQLLRDRWNNRARLAELQKASEKPRLLMYHGTADSIVPVEMGRELAAESPQWIEFHEMNGMEHNDLLDVVCEDICRRWQPWKEDATGGAGEAASGGDAGNP